MRFRFLIIVASVTASKFVFAQDKGIAADPVQQVALDVIRMKACETSWNFHVQEAANSGEALNEATMQEPAGEATTIGNVAGTKYSFSGNTEADIDICGWYFVPNGAGFDDDGASAQLSKRQGDAIKANMRAFTAAGQEILGLIRTPQGNDRLSTTLTSNSMVPDAIKQYPQSVSDALKASDATLANVFAASKTAPRTGAPHLPAVHVANPSKSWVTTVFGGGDNALGGLREVVAIDMEAFNNRLAKITMSNPGPNR